MNNKCAIDRLVNDSALFISAWPAMCIHKWNIPLEKMSVKIHCKKAQDLLCRTKLSCCFHFLATAVVQCTNIEGGKYYFPPGFLIHREKQ